MIPIPIRARGLRRRTVQLPAERLLRASVFPCFDAPGDIQRLLIIPATGRRLLMVRPQGRRIEVPLFGVIQMRGLSPSVVETAADARALSGLWHFDPGWALNEPRYADHPAAPLLRRTNCPDLFNANVVEVLFSRELTALQSVAIKDSGQQVIRRFEASMLPAPPVFAPPPSIRGGGWRLDPIWTRWGRRPSEGGLFLRDVSADGAGRGEPP